MFARKVHTLDNHAEVVVDPHALGEIRSNIEAGDVYIFKNVIGRDFLIAVRSYLTNVGRNSLPNYQAIVEGCPNFHRMNLWDERSYVQACFHQFVFFPWNQDVFALFERIKQVYAMRNLIAGLPEKAFLNATPEAGCTARIAFQFYPRGAGGMNKHRDPYDKHQLTVPIITMSEKGKDFMTGGAFVEQSADRKLFLDDVTEIGDVIYFNSQTPHGVDKVDPDHMLDWLSFEGRWMTLVAVNKLAGNNAIADAEDLDRTSRTESLPLQQVILEHVTS